ncbi:MAG: PDZ domain-containing protein [Caryophanon sp.]|nr:PDZ domain-containing protein [Caryophanon sp.]
MKKLVSAFMFACLTFGAVHTNAASVDEVRTIIEENYADELPTPFYEASSIEGMMETLDPYSQFFTRQEYEQYIQAVDLETVGIGVYLTEHEQGVLISDVIKEGPAEQAGLVAGTIILQADGTSLAGRSSEEAASYLKGPAGSNVKLMILTPDGQITTLTLTRQKFSSPQSETVLLHGNIGYIALYTFSDNADRLMRNALSDLRRQGATSFIVDLQGNGGGYVDVAERIIGMFPNAKTAYILHDRFGESIAPSIGTLNKFPLNTRVLIDEYSASASEMTAAALQDQQAAILYGHTSYGKGSMQRFFELRDGSHLKLTIATFTGPNKQPIHGVGVTPDIETDYALEDAHFDALVESGLYDVQPPLIKDPKTSSLHIMHKQLAVNMQERYAFIELGTNRTIDFTARKSGKRYARFTLNEQLQAGHMYALITKPTASQRGKIQKIIIEQ